MTCAVVVCGLAFATVACGASQVRVDASIVPVGHAVRRAANFLAPDGKTPVRFVIVGHDESGWHAFSAWAPDCSNELEVVAGVHGDLIKDPCSGDDWNLSGTLLAGPSRDRPTALPVQIEGSDVIVPIGR